MKSFLASRRIPFHSSAVSAIYDNLTPEEATLLKEYYRTAGGVYSWKAGALFGGLMGLLTFPALNYCIRYTQQPWGFLGLLVVAILLAFVIGLIRCVPIRKRVIRILCDSAYAKEKGYTPDNLPLYSYRRKNPNKASHRMTVKPLNRKFNPCQTAGHRWI